MQAKHKSLEVVILSLFVSLFLSCNLMSSPPAEQPSNPSLQETDIALRVMSTSLAIQEMTLESAQVQMTEQARSTPTQPPPPTQTSLSAQSPTEEMPPSPVASATIASPAALVLGIQKSVDEFYCYDLPFEVTITVQVSDINRGMAIYYHIRDKVSGVRSDGQVTDLNRRSANTRSVTIIGGGSDDQNLRFPPLMGESYFVYQIISDDGKYRSPVYNDITFFPCAQ